MGLLRVCGSFFSLTRFGRKKEVADAKRVLLSSEGSRVVCVEDPEVECPSLWLKDFGLPVQEESLVGGC
jgi:hypothetical protein